jgi:hypothetical protein
VSSRDALGKRLFQRVGRDRVELTAAGRRLFEFIEPFFVELTAVASGISAGSLGVLRMDAAALELRYILPRWIQRLRKSRPDIDIDWKSNRRRTSRGWRTARSISSSTTCPKRRRDSHSRPGRGAEFPILAVWHELREPNPLIEAALPALEAEGGPDSGATPSAPRRLRRSAA